jgi:S1-C subfamily serine protease
MSRNGRIAAAWLTGGLIIGAAISEQVGRWRFESQAAAQPAETEVSASTPPTLTLPPPGPEPRITAEEERNIQVYDSVNRSVVNIDTTTVERDSFFMLEREAEGSGSGAVIDKQGHIITNFHVIDGAKKIDVTLASNRICPAELVGGDKEHDIAILKIDAPAEELFPIPLGRSDNLRVGQRVYALGNPFGWDGTMTTGIISSLNRNLPSRIPGRQMQSLIQTDAAMNPGNSGGPLLNTAGQMIGMCVAIATRTGQSAGVGFAIPIDRIKWILPQLIDHGHVVRADIGILDVIESNSALVIRRLDPNGPAAKAGLRGVRLVTRQRRVGAFVLNETKYDESAPPDRIVAVDGEQMRTGVQFRDKIWAHKPGDTVVLTVVRDGRPTDISVTLTGD